jgi:hypothetical protein
MAKFPLHPKNPERLCWGCEKLCPADDMRCGNGTIRSPHPCELMGKDWYDWLQERGDLKGKRPRFQRPFNLEALYS